MDANLLDESQKAPAAFLQAVQQLADKLGLDAQKLSEGARVEYKGIDFWLHHHGAMDRNGLTLSISTGTIPPQAQAGAYRHLLTHNAMTPAALHGYFGMMPDADIVLFCIRFDLDKTHDAADAIIALIGTMAYELQQTIAALSSELERMAAGTSSKSLQAVP